MHKSAILICLVLLLVLLVVLHSVATEHDSGSVGSRAVRYGISGAPASEGPRAPGPGVYAAAPFSLLVVVPNPSDEKMIVAPDLSVSRMTVVVPESRLKKR